MEENRVTAIDRQPLRVGARFRVHDMGKCFIFEVKEHEEGKMPIVEYVEETLLSNILKPVGRVPPPKR